MLVSDSSVILFRRQIDRGSGRVCSVVRLLLFLVAWCVGFILLLQHQITTTMIEHLLPPSRFVWRLNCRLLQSLHLLKP